MSTPGQAPRAYEPPPGPGKSALWTPLSVVAAVVVVVGGVCFA
ncbi:hypothetical protein [Streptomyces sp. SID13726]|nr:hypothetical protein [Streptomyces sp. SID13726]